MEFYNQHAKDYFDETVALSMDEVVARFLPYLPKGSEVLDLGCGSGRDSLHFIQRGFKVTALDGSAELADIAAKHINQNVLVQDFNALQLTQQYDGIWACASLLHLPKSQLPKVLTTLHKHLTPNGAFYVSLKAKIDSDEEVDDKGRFFAYYDMDEICELLDSAGFAIIERWEESKQLRNMTQTWLNIIVRRHG